MALPLILAAPKPDADYGIQAGDDGSVNAHHHPNGDHGHDITSENSHNHHHEDVVSAPLSLKKKICNLVRETTESAHAYSPTACYNKPECREVCTIDLTKQCEFVNERECQTRNVTSCNTISKEKCQIIYETEYEMQCTTIQEDKWQSIAILPVIL